MAVLAAVERKVRRVGAGWSEIAPRPFRLRALPADLRPFAGLAFAVIAGWATALVLTAAGAGPRHAPRDLFGLMDGSTWGPVLVRLAVVAGFGVAAVAATAAAVRPGWGTTRSSRFARRGVLVLVAVMALPFAHDVIVRGFVIWTDPSVALRARAIWTTGVGWTALVGLLALPLLPAAPGLRRLALGLAGLPFGAWIVAALVTGHLTEQWLANSDWRRDVLYDIADSLDLVMILFLALEVFVWVELVASGAAALSRRLPIGRRAVLALVAVKLAWVAAGLAGVLPAWLGGNAAAWDAMRDDGAASWILAAAIAAGVVVVLTRSLRLTSRTGPLPSREVALVLGALYLPGLAAGVLYVLEGPVGDIWPVGGIEAAALVVVAIGVAQVAVVGWAGTRDALANVSPLLLVLVVISGCLLFGFLAGAVDLAADYRQSVAATRGVPRPQGPVLYEIPAAVAAHYFLAPALAFVAALGWWLHLRRSPTVIEPPEDDDALRRRRGALALLAAGLAGVALLYVVPRLPQVPLDLDEASVGATGDMFMPDQSYNVFPLQAPAWERGWNGVAGTFELATLDLLLSLGLAGLVWRGWKRGGQWRVLAFTLLGATVLAHSSTLMPTGWLGNQLYYVAFVVPLVWQFLYRGDDLVELAGRHPALALVNLAVISVLMTLLGYHLVTGQMDPTVEFADGVLRFTRGFSIALIVLPLGAVALSRRLAADRP